MKNNKQRTREEVRDIDGRPYRCTIVEETGEIIGQAAADPLPAPTRPPQIAELRQLASKPAADVTREDQVRMQQLTAWALQRLLR